MWPRPVDSGRGHIRVRLRARCPALHRPVRRAILPIGCGRKRCGTDCNEILLDSRLARSSGMATESGRCADDRVARTHERSGVPFLSTPQSRAHAPSCPVVHGSPLAFDGPKVPLYSSEFAADPHRVYREMQRQYGSLAPVELAPGVPATLVVGYDTAVRILNDPEHFPADPRTWQKNIPTDCPVLPLMEWRPIASKSTGGTSCATGRPLPRASTR